MTERIGKNTGRALRIGILCIALLALAYQFGPVRDRVLGIGDSIQNRFDDRPPKFILFIGNSRTFMHDMPRMIRKIADSAGNPDSYRITTHAIGGATLRDHWENPEVQDLLEWRWNNVVLQSQSSEQLSPDTDREFREYGAKLIAAARGAGAVPVLYVTWRYGDNFPDFVAHPEWKREAYERIQQSHRALAAATGAREVNAGKVWETLPSARMHELMEDDANHQTLEGSYLVALMFYRFFSGDDLSHVTYVPSGISQDTAVWIRKAAADAL